MKEEMLRQLPSIDELMNTAQAKQLCELHDREVVVNAARTVVDQIRSKIVKGEKPPEDIGTLIEAYLEKKFAPSLTNAVNAAGIILHTGLGRAMLPQAAVDAIQNAIQGYCTLAVDIETGQRGSRDSHVSDLLCELTGAEAATIVNNNAAATMLILNTLAKGKEVIVSRGQLVEIGGSFRMPDVMEASGAILKEVGTTNKTHLKDYAAAINENTGAILRVHQSNYRIVGFTEEPGIAELAKLAKEHDLPLIDDLGSGALIDLNRFRIEREPMVQDSIKAGADVVCFSGDKLIGGPQSGIIVGKAAVVEKIKKNQLMRALRVGKMTVAGMEATLKLFLDKSRLTREHPTYRMLSLSPADLEPRVKAVADKLSKIKAEVGVVDGSSQVGSGSVPAETMPTKLLSVRPNKISADSLAKKLRRHNPPIFARLHQEAVLFDFRTIQPDEDVLVVKALKDILGK